MIAFLAPLLLKLSPIGRFVKAIPKPVWMAIGVLLLIGGLWWFHSDAVSDARKAGHKAGITEERARATANAIRWKGKIDALTTNITRKLRSKSDAAIGAIDRDAGSVLMRGPGKAVCPGVAGGARASSGRVAPIGETSNAVAPLPDRERIDLIAMPFPGAVETMRSRDACLIEAQAWRDQNQQLKEARERAAKP